MTKSFRSTTASLAALAALIFCDAAGVAAAPRTRARASAPTPSSGACVQLNGDLDHLSKSLAMNFAEGVGDNSAPRATMREAQYNNLLTRARMTMDLMRDNHCRMPASVPTGEQYTGAALTCHTDMLEAQLARKTTLPDSCDQSRWTPAGHN